MKYAKSPKEMKKKNEKKNQELEQFKKIKKIVLKFLESKKEVREKYKEKRDLVWNILPEKYVVWTSPFAYTRYISLEQFKNIENGLSEINKFYNEERGETLDIDFKFVDKIRRVVTPKKTKPKKQNGKPKTRKRNTSRSR